MDQIYILALSRTLTLSLDRIALISPRIHVIDARQKFDQEIRESWPQQTISNHPELSTEGGASAQSELEREKGRRERDGEYSVRCHRNVHLR